MQIEIIDGVEKNLLNVASSYKNNETKCTKMTDENDSTIKIGINGASSSVSTAITNTIHVSRGNPILSNNNGTTRGVSNRLKCESSRVIEGGENELTGNKVANNDFGRIPTSSTGNDGRLINHQGVGGRLQFFKDGKFILELARSKEGEKCGWISVPRKTFRSPSATSSTVTPTYPKNESSTSLSFSDDNSSIQSSPWQRDHCWKQTSPRKGISKEMCLYFRRTNQIRLSANGFKSSKIKKRKPYDNSFCKAPFRHISTAGSKKNGLITPESNTESTNDDLNKNSDTFEQKATSDESSNDLDKPNKQIKINGEERLESGAKLSKIIQKLGVSVQKKLFSLSKHSIAGGAVNSISSTTTSRLAESHYHQPHVSPRKRILREFEKVSLEDNKRSRAKGNSPHLASSTNSLPTSKVQIASSHTHNASNHHNQSAVNGNRTEANSNNINVTTAIASTKSYSSYTINSLLGNCSSNTNNKSKDQAQINICNDPSYLRTMLASPKSPENYVQSYGKASPYSVSGTSRKRSPPYSPLHDIHHSRIRSPTIDGIYGNIRSPESSQNRSLHSARSTPPGVHPYLSSPKYSNSTITDNNKIKSEQHHSNSPNHHIYYSPYHSSPKYRPSNALSPNRSSENVRNQSSSPNNMRIIPDSRPPSLSAFSQSPQHVNRAGGEISPANVHDNLCSPGLTEQRREETTPRTVPKKTVSIRQQFASSTPSPSHGDHSNYHYKSSEQKHNIKADERTNLSPESSKTLSGYVQDGKHGMRSSSAATTMPPSSMYYMYSPNNVSQSSHSSASSYIPPVPYYHQYAAAVAALRNPLWMPYPPGVLPPHAAAPSRLLPSSFFPYNGVSATSLASTSHLHSPLTSMHLSAGHLGLGQSLDPIQTTLDEPVPRISIKEEHSSDVPLNLSKH